MKSFLALEERLFNISLLGSFVKYYHTIKPGNQMARPPAGPEAIKSAPVRFSHPRRRSWANAYNSNRFRRPVPSRRPFRRSAGVVSGAFGPGPGRPAAGSFGTRFLNYRPSGASAPPFPAARPLSCPSAGGPPLVYPGCEKVLTGTAIYDVIPLILKEEGFPCRPSGMLSFAPEKRT